MTVCVEKVKLSQTPKEPQGVGKQKAGDGISGSVYEILKNTDYEIRHEFRLWLITCQFVTLSKSWI